MAEYRLKAGLFSGTGQITINGGTDTILSIEEGSTVNVSIVLDEGFVGVEWFLNNVSQGTSLSFSFSMPARDSTIRAVISGTYAPIDDYAVKYTYTKTNRLGEQFLITIEEFGYGGSPEERAIESAFYYWGNRGADIVDELIVPSRLVMNFVDTNGYDDLLTGDNRKFRCRLYLNGDANPFFTGYISPNQLSYQLSDLDLGIQITAIDGTNVFGFTRGIPNQWSGATTAEKALSGVLNQTFIEKRAMNLACSLWESRMNLSLSPFPQFRPSDSCFFENGERLTYEGSTGIINEYLFCDEMVKRMTNIFTGRVYLWRDEWYFTRLDEYNLANALYFKFDTDADADGTLTLSNDFEFSCLNGETSQYPDVVKQVAYNEFTANLKLGVLQPSTNTADIDYSFTDSANYYLTSFVATPPNTYKLSRWDYIKAIASQQPSSVPSGNTALIQYASEGGFTGLKIWTTTTYDGLSDPNISWIELSSRDYGVDLSIVQEIGNVFTLNVEFLLQSVTNQNNSPLDFGNHSFGIMVKIGTQYLYRDTPTSFAWTLTETVMTFQFPNEYQWNSLVIPEAVVPETGEMTVRLYQAIFTGAPANKDRYALVLRNFNMKIDQNSALVDEEISWKGISNVGWNLVYNEIETYQGDALTIESTSALRLDIAPDYPVSETWTRDGIEELKLLQVVVLSTANAKGFQPQRQIYGVTIDEPDPRRGVSYIGSKWIITYIAYDVWKKQWNVELTEKLDG